MRQYLGHAGFALENIFLLQVLHHDLHHRVDLLLGFAGIEGVAQARPHQLAIGRDGGVEVGFDAHGAVVAQIVRRIDLPIGHGVIAVERVVVPIRNGVDLAGNVGDVLLVLHEPRHQHSFDLVLANLRLQIIHVQVRRLRPQQDVMARNGLDAVARESGRP